MRYQPLLWLSAILGTAGSFGALAQAWELPAPGSAAQLRDPFAFVKECGELPKVPVLPYDGEKDDHDALLLEAALSNAQAALKLNALEDALGHCRKGLGLRAELDPPAHKPEWQGNREKLLRVQYAAERLLKRRQTEADFQALQLKLEGVLVSAQGAQALINGTLLNKGDAIPRSGALTDAILADLHKDYAIILFRGLRIQLRAGR